MPPLPYETAQEGDFLEQKAFSVVSVPGFIMWGPLNFKKAVVGPDIVRTPLIPALLRQGQAGLCEFGHLERLFLKIK